MNNKNILFEKKDKIALLTLNRPEALNVLNQETLNELQEILLQIQKDKTIRSVVITGAGKAFAAGADISEMAEMNPAQAKAFAQFGQKLFSFIETMPQPVIACINGFALGGGCELACACDLRTAGNNIKIGEPEVKLGIIPGFGGSVRLPRLIGLSRAKQMILFAEALTAAEASEIGLIHFVFEPKDLLAKTLKIAHRLTMRPASALAAAKKALRATQDLTFSQSEEMEASVFSECFNTPDQKEGMRAFLEKRLPKFEA